MSDARIRIEIEDAIATLTIARPEKLNAFDIDMLKALGAACDTIEADAGVRVAILTGEGKAFCAGGDIKAWGAHERRRISAINGCASATASSSGWQRCACR